MTCFCDSSPLEELEALLTAAQAHATAMRASVAGLPVPCAIIPYHQGATNEQKKCHVGKSLAMYAKWFYCALQQDPSACFDGACEDYATDVDSCYAA